MDNLKKFTTNELIMLGGCVVVFFGVFFTWFGIDTFLGSATRNGFNYFFFGIIPWLLAIAVAAVLIIKKLAPSVSIPDLPMAWNQVYLIGCGISGALILIKLLSGDSPYDRKFGLYLSTLGGIAMAVGAYLKFQAKEEDAAEGGSTPPTSF